MEYTAAEVDDRADSSADISIDSEFEVQLDMSAEELNRETDGGEELEERRNPSPKQRKKMQQEKVPRLSLRPKMQNDPRAELAKDYLHHPRKA